MLQLKKGTSDQIALPVSNSELIFPGGNFALEKRVFPLLLSVNYAILGLVLICSAPFSLESVGWTAVIFALSAGIFTKLRGRWLALMAFSVPILLKIVQVGMGEMNFMILWIVWLISISAAYSSFNVISGFARWLKARKSNV